MKIAASYLSIDDLKGNIDRLTKCDIDYLHVDVMDGEFVPSKTPDVRDIIKDSHKPLDVHLMVCDVKNYIDLYLDLKPEFITFHYEANCDIMSMVMYLKEHNVNVGLAINPDTSIECILPYLPFVDMVLVMSVYPGKGGQAFIPTTLDKLDKLQNIKEQYEYSYLIEVDGGINDSTISSVKLVDIAVIGSYITNGDYQERIENIKEKIYG
jgi:ribulose-phosphate 3-epimerase